MPYTSDLSERTKRFLAKDAALRESIQVTRGFAAIGWVLAFAVFGTVLGACWGDGSWHPLVYAAVGAFFTRVSFAVAVYHCYTKPRLAEIEKRFGDDDGSP